jgi:hypothetical protein
MDDKIKEYLNLLRNNIVVVRRYKRPDWFVGTDTISDIELNKANLLNEKEYQPLSIGIEVQKDDLLFPDSIKRYELNGFQKDYEFEQFLILHFEEFKAIFTKDNLWDKKDTKEAIANHVRKTRNLFDHFLHRARLLEDSEFNSIIKVKTDVCMETLRFVNFPMQILQQFNNDNPRPIRKKKQIVKLTSLTQNQIVILFHSLKELGYIGDEMQKNIYAHHISELTGYAEEKIRQDLSHIVKNPDGTNTVEFSEIDYSVVKRTLDKVIAKVKKDSEERFPPKP